jgi:ABC-type multidrug transport system fused ATPase/permease subunit
MCGDIAEDKSLEKRSSPTPRSNEEHATLLSRIAFGWVIPLLQRGMQRKKEAEENGASGASAPSTNPIQQDDLLVPPSDESSTEVYRAFMAVWSRELERVGYVPGQALEDGREPRLLWALMRAFKRDLIISGTLRLLSLSSLALPFFLRLFVQWMQDFSDPNQDVPSYLGFVWGIAIPLTALVSNVLNNQHSHYSLRAHLRMRGACALALFDKALVLWPHHGLGGLVTQMHSSDTFKFFEMYQYLHWLWISPLQIVVSLVCLYIFIGWAGVMSIGVMVVALPLQSLALNRVADAQRRVSKSADVRQGLVREVVRGIRIIKFMGLEKHMAQRMDRTREVEINDYDHLYFWKALTEVLATFTPVLVTFVVFIAAWLLGDPVTSDSLFATTVMLQLLRTPVVALSQSVAKLDELRISVRRIQDFLLFDERYLTLTDNNDVDENSVPNAYATNPLKGRHQGKHSADGVSTDVGAGEGDFHALSTAADTPGSMVDFHQTCLPLTLPANDDNVPTLQATAAPHATCSAVAPAPFSHIAISLVDVTIMKEIGDRIVPVFEDVNLDFAQGSLTVIYGPTGSGKSLILQAIIKEVLLHPNSVVVTRGELNDDRVAYVPQDAYLRRGTVRDNVLFGASYDADRFERVAACSQLASDLLIMEEGDMTMLTDRGMNMSGGQRQRIAVARAAYADSNIVLLDDPLSALDPIVGRKLARECICGWMKSRTRVLVTNQTDMLLLADQIVITTDLKIAFVGNVQALQNAGEDVRKIFPADAHASLFGAARRNAVQQPMAAEGQRNGNASPLSPQENQARLPRDRSVAFAEPPQFQNQTQQQSVTFGDTVESRRGSATGEDAPHSPLRSQGTSTVSTSSRRRGGVAASMRVGSAFQFPSERGLNRKRSTLDRFRTRAAMSSKDNTAVASTVGSLFGQHRHQSFTFGDGFEMCFSAAAFVDSATFVEPEAPCSPLRSGVDRAAPSRNLDDPLGLMSPKKVAVTTNTNDASPRHMNVAPVVWHIANQSRLYFALTMMFCVFQRTAIVFADLIVSYWAARTSVFGIEQENAGYAAWYSATVGVALVCLTGFNVCYFIFGASHAVRQTHTAMFHRLLHAPTSFFDANSFGAIVGRFSRDLDCVDRSFLERLNTAFYNTAIVLGSCVLMCYAAPYLAAVLVAVSFLYWALLRYYNVTAANIRSFEASSRTPMVSLMGEALTGLDVIRSYGMSERFRAEHTSAYEASARALYNVGSLQLWFNQQLGVLNAAIILFMTILVAGLMTSYDYSKRESQRSVLSLAVTYIVSLSLGFLMNMLTELQTFYGSVERVAEYATCLEQESGAPSWPMADESRPSVTSADATTEWPLHGGIVFDNVCLRYRPDLPRALNGLSVTIQPGEHIGVVGRTGSGKSTLIQALFRLVELDGGRVTIDDVDTQHVPLDRLRSAMTIVPQDPMIFRGTVRANMDPLEQYSTEQCDDALHRVGLAEAFQLESSIGESGENLSTGQRQLLCLARAMVRNRPILIMDEATANVDGATDARMQEIVRTDFSKLTTITIAHRLDTIIDCDKILVMDNGSLAEFDTPKSLLANRDSVFYNLARGLGDEQLAKLILHTMNSE